MQDIQNKFEGDNFTSRRTTGHNMFDPESLMTGAEAELGFTYANSHRNFPDAETYDKIVSGEIPATEVPKIAPRVLNNPLF